MGCWLKLICGASHHHLPNIYILTAAYALAGAECIDVAADADIVEAAREGLNWAEEQAVIVSGRTMDSPWLMVSISDGEDPHFRKARFEPAHCLEKCPQPCVTICPADAISFSPLSSDHSGVIDSRCYGCGRCLPVCPIGHIQTQSYVSSPGQIATQLFSLVDAVEIHTQIGRIDDFESLWRSIWPWRNHLRAISVSCPDGEGGIQYLWQIYEIIQPAEIPVIWQTDGRPMSGDIGIGTTHATIRYAQKVLAAGPPGFVQLAGGTNSHTVPRLRDLGLLGARSAKPARRIAGVAYGSYARKHLLSSLNQISPALDADFGQFDKSNHLPPCSSVGSSSTVSHFLSDAVALAEELVNQIKLAPEILTAEPVQ